MKYTLTRDDLKTLGNGIRNANSMSVEEHLDAFLADKKTNDWQVIASGEVKTEPPIYHDPYCPSSKRIGDKDLLDLFEKYEGKDIEIIVKIRKKD